MNPLKLLVLVATSIFLFGCAGGPIITETKFTTYEDFQPGPDSGVDLVWADIRKTLCSSAQSCQSK